MFIVGIAKKIIKFSHDKAFEGFEPINPTPKTDRINRLGSHLFHLLGCSLPKGREYFHFQLSLRRAGHARSDRNFIIPQPLAICQEENRTKINFFIFPILCILTIAFTLGMWYTIRAVRGG